MRILMVQRSLSPPGGGNAVAAWMIHALAAEHQVSTITTGGWSVAAANAFYGTSIPEGAVSQRVIPPPWRWLSSLPEDRLTRLRMCAVLRYAREISDGFDLLITADNFGAFSKPGLQYVHFPAGLQPRPARWPAIVNVYFAACGALLGGRWTDASRNLTLANSQWTADGLARGGEVSQPVVLYPPVVDPGEGLPWDQRDEVFLCVGRFHRSKRIETAIAIVGQVRARIMPGARLLIVGSPVDREYSRGIHRVASNAGEWVEFREDLSRAELNALMGRSRYGLQAMEHEHFGMAAAEMTRAGCLVFAHRSGGSPEVLNHEDALLWTQPDDVIAKLEHLDVPRLRARLRAHARSFSTERFVDRCREIVATSAAGSRDR